MNLGSLGELGEDGLEVGLSLGRGKSGVLCRKDSKRKKKEKKDMKGSALWFRTRIPNTLSMLLIGGILHSTTLLPSSNKCVSLKPARLTKESNGLVLLLDELSESGEILLDLSEGLGRLGEGSGESGGGVLSSEGLELKRRLFDGKNMVPSSR